MADTAPQDAPESPETDPPEGGGEGESQQPSEAESKLSRKYANLSRQQREFKRQQAEWAKEREAGKAELARLNDLRQKARSNPGAWLQAGNVSPQDLNAYLTQNTQRANDPYEQRISEETRKVREELAAYKAELQEMKSAQEKSRNIDKIKGIVDSKPDDFELIRHYEAQADVAEFIDLYLAEHGERITEAEACARIEQVLEAENEQVVRRALATRKLAKRIGWQKPGESDDDAESQPGEEDGAPAPDKPPAQQRSKPTRGKPKLTNAAPTSSRRQPTEPVEDAYALEKKWENHVARKTKRR